MKKKTNDNYALMIFGLIMIVLGILQIKQIIVLDNDSEILKENPKFFGAIITIVGFLCFIFPLIKELSKLKYRKSAYHDFKKMEDSEIQNRLILIGETPIIERDKENITISIRQEHGSFDLTISLKEAYAEFNCESDEYHDSLIEVEQESMDNLEINFDVLANSALDILNKFVNFVLMNK